MINSNYLYSKKLQNKAEKINELLCINNKKFVSRLMLGTGKYENLKTAQKSIETSGTEIVTVAIRRAQSSKSKGYSNLIDGLNWNKLWLLPNTAGCETSEEAIRIAYLGREIAKKIGQIDNNFIKLEVISDSQYLLPDPIGTLKAAEYLVKKKFTVLPYINSDPILAKQLEDIGCSTVMPLGSPIGSGQGLKHIENLKIIIENCKIPVIIDAGIGSAKDTIEAMEIGASGILLNTAIARAKDPRLMAEAMKWSVIAGRKSYLAGIMNKKNKATPSSPIKKLIQ
uniref:Thiazole synthase n=1 Tax=Spyridia filamentosa TaxID=196632 RepID=A0A1Z1MJ96_SPYFI|nr:thiG protein [Spyridia filamentosa]ARW66128.1 thiG protein [Spyridia filamentosa]